MSGFTGNDGSGLVGGLNPSGQVKALSVDNAGNLNVNASVSSGPTNITQINSAAVSATNGLPISGNNGGSLVVLDVDSSGRLIVGNLAQIGGATPQIDNSHELGVSLYGKGSGAAGDTPLLLNSDGSAQIDIRKVLGAAMSVNNPLISADLIRYALINGTLYSLGMTASSTGASSAAIALFGGAGGISKNTLIVSVYGSSIGNQVILKCGTLAALDANVATNTTPTPLKAGGAASLYTGSNAAINAPTGTSNPTYTGSFFRYITEQANVAQELAITGMGIYYIPANTANAGFEAVLVQGSAAGIYALNLIWAEF